MTIFVLSGVKMYFQGGILSKTNLWLATLDDGKQKTLTLALDLSRVSAVGELFKSPYDLWESYSG